MVTKYLNQETAEIIEVEELDYIQGHVLGYISPLRVITTEYERDGFGGYPITKSFIIEKEEFFLKYKALN